MGSQISLDSFLAIAPELGLLVLMVAVLAYDKGLKPLERRKVGLVMAWGSVTVLILTVVLWLSTGEPDPALNWQQSLYWGGMIRHDMATLVFRVIFLIALPLICLISLDTEHLQRGEYFALLASATIGFSLMAASADLIMLFVALETASISLYILAGYSTKEGRSTEAGMKYFVYGAFASAVMLYGMSLIYGLTGGTNMYEIGSVVLQVGQIPPEINGVLLLAAIMLVAGFGFKIAAVPFHFWTPDVYEGAPASVTAFLSTASKAAGFAVFLRVFSVGMLGQPSANSIWWSMLVAMTVVTMSLGNFFAIYQKNIKRMLAYSSIAQAGYTLIGLVTMTPDGAGAAMYYLLMYVVTNIAAFGVVILVSNKTGADDMKDFYGLSRRSPYLALAMMLALLSLGGIPPTAGFVGKFFIFKATIDAGLWWLALIGVLNAFIALYYYFNVIKYMYLYRSEGDEEPIFVSRAASLALTICVLGIMYLGIIPSATFEWTKQAGLAFFLGG